MNEQTGVAVPIKELISHMYSEGVVCSPEVKNIKPLDVAKKLVGVFLTGDSKAEHGSIEACMLWALKRSSPMVKVIVLRGFLHPKAVLEHATKKEVSSFEADARNREIVYEAKKKNA